MQKLYLVSFIANPQMTTISVNRICGVMVSVLASGELDRGFEPQSCNQRL